MTADERAKAVKQARTWLGRADDAGFLARALVSLDAQLTAVEKERDEAWWHAAHNDEKAVAAEKDNQRLEAMLDQLRTFNQSPTAALLAEENQRLREVLIRLGQFARREIDAALSQDTSC